MERFFIVYLPSNDFEVVVALGARGTLTELLEAAAIKTISIPALQRDISIWKELKAIWQIAGIIKAERPDILHVNSSKAGGYGSLLGRLFGVPRIIFTAHGWAFNEDRSWWQRIILKCLHYLTILFAHQTICVSKTLQSQLAWPGTARKTTVVYNGRPAIPFLDHDTARLRLIESCPDLQAYSGDPWSITIGELHPVKQHDVVMRAVAQVVEAVPNYRHLIIGAGEQQAQLEALIAELHLEEHVFLLGSVPEAATYLTAADLFVLGSRSEAFALVIIEAAQAGLPIVASRVGGIPEIITDSESGLLVPAGDVSAFSRSIATLLKNPELQKQLGTAAQRRSADFSIERMLSLTTQVYRATR